MFALLRNPRILMMSTGTLLNTIGNWSALLAILGIAATRLHVSALALALLTVSWTLPRALLGPVPGSLVDRFGPKRVLYVAYIFDALLTVGFIVADSYVVLLVLGVAHGVAFACSMPAENAVPAQAVTPAELPAVNALFAASMQLGVVLGPVLGAVLLAVGGPLAALLGNVASYVLAVACLVPLRLRPVQARDRARARDAIVHARRNLEVLLLLIVAATQSVAFGALSALEPVYVRDVLGRGSGAYAVIQGVFGVGLVVGTVWGVRRGAARLRLRSIASHMVVSGSATSLLLATPSLAISAVASGVMGLATAGVFQPAKSSVQVRSPESMHGRMLALFLTTVAWAELPARGAAGVLSARVGIPTISIVAGGLMVAVALLVLVVHRFRLRHGDRSRLGTVLVFPCPARAVALAA